MRNYIFFMPDALARVQPNSLDEAMKLMEGNPVFEAGGAVETRELLRS